MRITGGKYCSRIVECPPGIIRPAMDRMRESLFSILGPLTGYSFLDFFSGSGCVAIEAASRGASPIHLVEGDFKKKYTILKNLSFVEEEKRVFIMDVHKFMRKKPGLDNYDIVYLDPPFPFSLKKELIDEVFNRNLCSENGKVIMHYPTDDRKYFENLDNEEYKLYDIRYFGRSTLGFFKKKDF